MSRSFLKIKSLHIGFWKHCLRNNCFFLNQELPVVWATNLKSNYTGSCKKNLLFIVMFVCLFLYSLTTLNSFIDLPVWQLIDFARSFLLSTQLDITHLDLLLSLNDLHYAQFVQFTWLNCTPFFWSYVEYLQKPYWKI